MPAVKRLAAADAADAVAQIDPVGSTGSSHRALANGEDDTLALLQRHHLGT